MGRNRVTAAGEWVVNHGDVMAGRVVGRRDPRRRVSVSPIAAERAKINAVGRNRVTTTVARERVPPKPSAHSRRQIWYNMR